MVEGDGVGYFSYLHSALVDHDLDLTDEYAAALAAGVTLNPEHYTTRTATGLPADYFPVGPAVLAAPFYAAALVAHPGGRPLFGPPFTTAFDVASLLFGLLALAMCLRLTRSAAAVAALALATPLTYYLVLQPSYSHTFSAFTVSLFTLAWWSTRGRRGAWGWFALGVLGGLMAAVRFQDGPLLLILLLDVPAARWKAALAVPGAVAGFAPQLAVDRVLFGGWLPQRPAGQDLAFWPGHYLDVLFSSYHGLFVWSPVVLVAAAGVALCRDRALKAACAFAFLVEVVLNGAAPDWWGGYAFGARRFLDLLPFMAVGLAEVARRVGPRVRVAAVAVLAAWNVVLIANLTYVQRSDHDPGLAGLLTGQMRALPHVANVFAQGQAGRDLLWWPVLHRPFAPGPGLLLLLAEGVALALAMAVARRGTLLPR